MTNAADDDQYDEARADIRSRWRSLWAVVLFGTPAATILMTLFDLPAIGYALIGVFLIALFRMCYVRCPRCGELAFQIMLFANPLPRRCLNCDLPLR